MLIAQLFENDIPGYQNSQDDKSVLKMGDSRKTRLTLLQINRLRMMNDVRKLEHEKHLERVSKQYKAAPEAGAAGMGGMASL
jgi:hypothetical protein